MPLPPSQFLPARDILLQAFASFPKWPRDSDHPLKADSTCCSVRSAMRRLNTSTSPSSSFHSSSSMVGQLYALALLNREDARRRMRGESMPSEMFLAQQPPSLLALAGPPPQVSTFENSNAAGFHDEGRGRQRPRTSGGISGRATGGAGSSRSKGRQFGAVSVAGQMGRSGAFSGGSEAIATRAIQAARVPSLAVTAVGADLSTSRGAGYLIDRACVDARCGNHVGGSAVTQERPRSTDALSPRQSGMGNWHGVSSRSTCQNEARDASSSRTALRVSDLERMGCPTKVSTLPVRRAAADAEALAFERKALDQARLSSSLPRASLPASDAALHDPLRPMTQSANAGSGAKAASGVLTSLQRSSHHAASYVPPPAPGGGVDPWKASEEDLKRQALGQGMAEDVAAVRRAAAVGHIGPSIMHGFG